MSVRPKQSAAPERPASLQRVLAAQKKRSEVETEGLADWSNSDEPTDFLKIKEGFNGTIDAFNKYEKGVKAFFEEKDSAEYPEMQSELRNWMVENNKYINMSAAFERDSKYEESMKRFRTRLAFVIGADFLSYLVEWSRVGQQTVDDFNQFKTDVIKRAMDEFGREGGLSGYDKARSTAIRLLGDASVRSIDRIYVGTDVHIQEAIDSFKEDVEKQLKQDTDVLMKVAKDLKVAIPESLEPDKYDGIVEKEYMVVNHAYEEADESMQALLDDKYNLYEDLIEMHPFITESMKPLDVDALARLSGPDHSLSMPPMRHFS